MIEIRGDKKVLITPVSAEDLKDIHIGDIVWLDGDLMTCRDVAHRRLVEYGRELPYNIKDKAIFHAGPIVRKIEGTEDDYEMVSVGPTTSMRMEKFEYEFTKLTAYVSLSEKAAWVRIPSVHVKNSVPFTVSSRQAARLLPRLRWKELQSITGMNWECRRRYGAIK